MTKHIGIVACSAEGAALCYRTICQEGAALLDAPHAHPEVSIHTHSLAAYVDCLERGDMSGIAALMLSSAEKLAAGGADFLICPDNTIHQAMVHVSAHSPLPWLHIADVVAAEVARRGFQRPAITGTKWLVDSTVYPDALTALDLGYVRPYAQENIEINRIIMDELVQGVFDSNSTAYVQDAIHRLKSKGADCVILGCTELPLIIDDANAALPTLDSTRLLARAALRHAAESP